MPKHPLLPALLALVALPAFAEGPRFASLTFENDFFAGYDRHYTNGVQVAFLAGPRTVVALGQRIYTPTDTDVDPPDPNDRPYAGWLYAMADIRTRTDPTVDHLTITAGVVGPASGAQQTQDGVHRLLGERGSVGWEGQVRSRPTLMAGYERAWPAIAAATLGSASLDLSTRVSANVGTPFTYASAGAVLRFGVDLPRDLPVTHISLGPPRDGFRGAASFGWYAWAGVDARAVAYNEFIQGATYGVQPNVSREPFGYDAQAGIAFAWPRARVGFTLVRRAREFRGQPGADRYGQLAISFAY